MPGLGEGRALQAQQAANKQQQSAADAQWQKALAANAGGGSNGFDTDFEQAAGLDGLRAMIESADPDALSTVAGHWSGIGDALGNISGGLGTHVDNLLQHWSGASADAFRTSAASLNESLSNGAGYAYNTSGALTTASAALSTAQESMPHAPSEWAKMSRAATSESNDWQFKQDAARKTLQYAVAKDGSQLSADEQAHQQAVVVMEALGTAYNHSASNLKGVPPKAGTVGNWPPPAPTPTGPPVTPPSSTVPGGPGESRVAPIGGGPGAGRTLPIATDPGQSVPGAPVIPPGSTGGGGGTAPGQPVSPGPGTTIDGSPSGPTTGLGPGSGGSGSGGPIGGGTGGYGSVGTVGGGKNGSGFGFGGVGGMGSGAFGAGDDGAGGYGGESGLVGGSADGGEGSATASATEAGEPGSGDGTGGSGVNGEAESGMGEMGGMGAGLGSSSGKKKKRKARAAYLVADEDAWGSPVAVNPAVIS